MPTGTFEKIGFWIVVTIVCLLPAQGYSGWLTPKIQWPPYYYPPPAQPAWRPYPYPAPRSRQPKKQTSKKTGDNKPTARQSEAAEKLTVKRATQSTATITNLDEPTSTTQHKVEETIRLNQQIRCRRLAVPNRLMNRSRK
jgi:hypothetical protein